MTLMHARRARRLYQFLLGPAALFLIVVLFNWKLVLTNQYTWLENGDLANLILPWFQLQATQWHLGSFPLWDPNSWFGQPLFGQAQPGAAYPLNWLLFLAPLKRGWIEQGALHWYYVLIHYLAALTAYALSRDLGRSRRASILAGCVYALGGYVAATMAPQMLNGAVWTPLVFLFLFRAERGHRPWASALLSGFFLGFGWLAGHHQMNLFVSLAATGLWLWIILRTGKLDLNIAKLAAASLLIAGLTSAFQTLPMAEYGRASVRWTGLQDPQRFNEVVPYSVHVQYALNPAGLLGIFVPNLAHNSNPFIGCVAFSLALLGAILAWKTPQVRWLSAIALAGLLFALGPTSLLHGALYSLAPLVDKARVPAAGVLLFALGIAPLAAFGVDLLPRPESFPWSRRAGTILAIFGGALALTVLILHIAGAQNALGDERVLITALLALLAAALFAGWRASTLSPALGAWLALALVLLELATVMNYNLPSRAEPAQNHYLHYLAEHGDVAAFIGAHGVPGRIEYDDQDIPYNFGDWYGLEAVNAYAASVLDEVWSLDVFSPRARDFFGVRYALGKKPPRAGLTELFTSRSGVKVFENAAAYPRIWSVHRADSLPDMVQLRAAFRDPSIDLRQTVLLTGEPAPAIAACQNTRDDELDMPLYQPNELRITANLACRGMVILTDTWFPGWKAWVDGHPAPIHKAYGSVRGVIVESGAHVIEMRYRPASVFLGLVLSVLAAVITLAACMISRTR
ncbi:MAG TPA: YfhO family protein [Bryobacteraceae bacterium]|jgi:hypothetical protein